jgi:MFS family permease
LIIRGYALKIWYNYSGQGGRPIDHPKAQPRIFYGYVVVILGFLIMLATFGLFDSFGVFLKPLLNDFGWSRATASAAYSISMIVFGVSGVILGGLTDRFGPRVVLTCAGLLLGLGYLLMSHLNSLWQLCLFEGVILGIGMSSLYAPILSLIARWFVGRRALMTGAVLTGMGIGQLGAPLVISALISDYGWRQSYVFIGIFVLVVVVLSSQFLKRDPAKTGQIPYGAAESQQHAAESHTQAYSLREAAGTRQLWIVFFMKLCFGYYLFSILVHIVPHATDLGITAVSAAGILALIGGGAIAGNFILGRAADKIGPRKVFIFGFLAAAVMLLWLTQVKELWMFCLFAVVLGFANGGNVTSDSPLVARLFGLKSIGSIVGVSSGAFSIGAALGPVISGYIFDSTRNYNLAFLICAIFCVVGLIMAAILKPTPRTGTKI